MVNRFHYHKSTKISVDSSNVAAQTETALEQDQNSPLQSGENALYKHPFIFFNAVKVSTWSSTRMQNCAFSHCKRDFKGSACGPPVCYKPHRTFSVETELQGEVTKSQARAGHCTSCPVTCTHQVSAKVPCYSY